MKTIIKQNEDNKKASGAPPGAALDKALQKKGLDTRKHCGVIWLKEDPVTIQKRMRDEWE